MVGAAKSQIQLTETPESTLLLEVLWLAAGRAEGRLLERVFPSTKPTPFFFERKCYGVNLFMTIIQTFLYIRLAATD